MCLLLYSTAVPGHSGSPGPHADASDQRFCGPDVPVSEPRLRSSGACCDCRGRSEADKLTDTIPCPANSLHGRRMSLNWLPGRLWRGRWEAARLDDVVDEAHDLGARPPP